MDLAITLLVVGSNVVLYTAYNKTTQKLDFAMLKELLTLQAGVDKFLVETNKLLALCGLSLLALSFLLGSSGLLWDSFWMLVSHTIYSTFKYYNSPNIPAISTWSNLLTEAKSPVAKTKLQAKRKFSNFCGVIALLLLIGFYYNVFPAAARNSFGFFMLNLSVLHFYFMEIDFKDNLNVRPFGYLPFVISSLAIFYLPYMDYFYS